MLPIFLANIFYTCPFLEILCAAPDDGIHTLEVDKELYKDNSIGDKFIYECQHGFGTNDSVESVCQSNNKWSISPPNCTGNCYVGH